MIDVRGHYINIDPEILGRNWSRYQRDYKSIESSLPRFNDITYPFGFKTHPLGGFFVSKTQLSSPLKDYFASPNGKFLLLHRNKLYSRGLYYYPGLLKDRSDAEKIKWILRTTRQITASFEAEDQKVSGSVLLAIAQDYIRNYLLILYYAFHCIAYQRYVSHGYKDEYDKINELFKSVILLVEVCLFRYLLKPKQSPMLPVSDIEYLCTKLSLFFKSNTQEIEEVKDKKLIREVREMDNLAHVYLFAQKIAKHHLTNDTFFIGHEYGGIELPFAINALRIMNDKSPLPMASVQVSNYSNRMPLKRFDDLFTFATERNRIINAQYAWILDDSVTTGRSLQSTLHLLPPTLKAAYFGIVMCKVSNRYHHLIMYGHGGINPVILRSSELLCQSNYSSTYKKNSYLNRAGVFDVNKHKLYKILGEDWYGHVNHL